MIGRNFLSISEFSQSGAESAPAFRSSIGLCAGKVEKEGNRGPARAELGAQCAGAKELAEVRAGAGLKTRRLVLDTVTELSGFNRGAKSFCEGPGQE